MPSVKERLSGWVSDVRKRRPLVDHAFRMQEHYSGVQAGQQAGAVTYFAFLSVFPILAIAFFVVGRVAAVYPDARADLVEVVKDVLPGLIGGKYGIQVQDIEDAASAAGIIGAIGLLYAGLGWLSAMRDALVVVFEEPRQAQPNFVFGKLRDLASLLLIGTVLLLAVALAGVVTWSSDRVLDWVGLDAELSWLVELIGRVIAFGANVLLFFTLFKLLSRPRLPDRSLWSGALLGAVAFEALKSLSIVLLASTRSSPAIQVFGIALILLVWINYTSRGTLYAAAWAFTTRTARALREQRALEQAQMQQLTRVDLHEAAPAGAASRGRTVKSFAAGGATALALVAVLKKKQDDDAAR